MSDRDTKQAAEQAKASENATTKGVEATPAAASTANERAATAGDGDADEAADEAEVGGEPLYDLTADERERLNKRDLTRLEKQQARVDDARGYYAGEWRGLRRWQCQACPYDSLDEATIVRHVTAVHRPAPVAAPQTMRVAPIVDRYGNPIIVTE